MRPLISTLLPSFVPPIYDVPTINSTLWSYGEKDSWRWYADRILLRITLAKYRISSISLPTPRLIFVKNMMYLNTILRPFLKLHPAMGFSNSLVVLWCITEIHEFVVKLPLFSSSKRRISKDSANCSNSKDWVNNKAPRKVEDSKSGQKVVQLANGFL